MYHIFKEFSYKSTSVLSRMPLADWLRYLLSILFSGDSEKCAFVNELAAAFLYFRSVCEEDLDKPLNDQYIYTKTIGLFALDFYARYS